jgi:thymidylate synthase
LFVALGVEGNLKCVHFYDNQFEAVETLLKEKMCTKTARRFLKNSKTCVNCLENQITLDVLFNLMSIDMFKLSGYTSDKAISVEMLAPIKNKKCQV